MGDLLERQSMPGTEGEAEEGEREWGNEGL